jgi:hypothetical protein
MKCDGCISVYHFFQLGFDENFTGVIARAAGARLVETRLQEIVEIS